MDKKNEFSPSREEATELADKYWSDLSHYSEKRLKEIGSLISSNAKSGKYNIDVSVLKGKEDYIKEKLEEAGYVVTIGGETFEKHSIFLNISFEK